jgi:hypothetical protein
MAAGLAFSSTAFVLFPLVDVAWQAFPPAVLAGIGGGTWLTLQPSVVAAVTPREVRHRRSPSNGSSRTWGSGSAV